MGVKLTTPRIKSHTLLSQTGSPALSKFFDVESGIFPEEKEEHTDDLVAVSIPFLIFQHNQA